MDILILWLKDYLEASPKLLFLQLYTRRELATLEHLIRGIDPKSFLIVMNTSEILGEGFKSLAEKTKHDI